MPPGGTSGFRSVVNLTRQLKLAMAACIRGGGGKHATPQSDRTQVHAKGPTIRRVFTKIMGEKANGRGQGQNRGFTRVFDLETLKPVCDARAPGADQ